MFSSGDDAVVVSWAASSARARFAMPTDAIAHSVASVTMPRRQRTATLLQDARTAATDRDSDRNASFDSASGRACKSTPVSSWMRESASSDNE